MGSRDVSHSFDIALQTACKHKKLRTNVKQLTKQQQQHQRHKQHLIRQPISQHLRFSHRVCNLDKRAISIIKLLCPDPGNVNGTHYRVHTLNRLYNMYLCYPNNTVRPRCVLVGFVMQESGECVCYVCFVCVMLLLCRVNTLV